MNYNKKRMIVAAASYSVKCYAAFGIYKSRDKDEYRRRSPLCGR